MKIPQIQNGANKAIWRDDRETVIYVRKGKICTFSTNFYLSLCQETLRISFNFMIRDNYVPVVRVQVRHTVRTCTYILKECFYSIFGEKFHDFSVFFHQ